MLRPQYLGITWQASYSQVSWHSVPEQGLLAMCSSGCGLTCLCSRAVAASWARHARHAIQLQCKLLEAGQLPTMVGLYQGLYQRLYQRRSAI